MNTAAVRCVTAILLLSTVITLAQNDTDKAGTVVAIRGDVQVIRADGAETDLKMKDEIRQKDVVRTGRRGRVQILFTDDTILSLGRDTQIEITECVFNRSEGQGALRLSIREGAFRIVGGAILKVAPENFSADTPTATIGIRGSAFAAEVTATETRVVLLSTTGAGIVVSNDDGYRIVYIPGTGVIVRQGEAPGPIIDMDELALRLLGITAVGGAPDQELPEKTEELPPPDDAPPPPEPIDMPAPGAYVDPYDIIPAYKTYAEAEEVLDNVLEDGKFPMAHGNAVGLDLTNGWALRTLDPDDAWFTVAISGRRLTAVSDGQMILHTQGTGDSADTFPVGPISSPAIAFTITDGTITGPPAVEVVESEIEPPNDPVDVSNWGWWSMEIADPNGVEPSHRVNGLWQGTALMQTAADWVADALLGKDFTGHYAGDAHCLRNGTDLLNGSSSLQLDFGDRTFNGNLDFLTDGGPTMELTGTVTASGLHGTVDNVSGESGAISSSMRAFFYGERAQSLQGAFDAQTPVNRYIGIFDAAGDIVPRDAAGPR